MANAPRKSRKPPPLPAKLDLVTIQRMVFETFDRRRFLQDSPIRPDVWLRAFSIADRIARWRIEKNETKKPRQAATVVGADKKRREERTDEREDGQPDDRIDVLITPVFGTGAGVVAERLRERLNADRRYQKPPPGPAVVEALVWKHLNREPPKSALESNRDEALLRVARWAGIQTGDPLESLSKKMQERLGEILPDGEWESLDQLRHAVRYALQKVVQDQDQAGGEADPDRFAQELFGQPQEIAQGMREVAASLTFPEIYKHVLPLTEWWRRLPERHRGQDEIKRQKVETVAQFISRQANPEYYRVSALVAFVMALYNCNDREAYLSWQRSVAVLLPNRPADEEEGEGVADPNAPSTATKSPPMSDEERIAALLAACADMEAPRKTIAPETKTRSDGEEPPDGKAKAARPKGIVWAIQCNRRAMAPQTSYAREAEEIADEERPSHATIKADAARRLFELSTDKLTWAVIDTGIDLRHAAFKKRSATDGEPQTRVKRVLDFALLRAIMSERVLPEKLPGWPDDDPKDIAGVAETRQKLLQALDFIMQRNRLARDLDWDIVAPLIERPTDIADEDKRKRWTAPTSDHGTHVAGILAGDWRVDKPVAARNVRPSEGSSADAEDAKAQENKEIVAEGLYPKDGKLIHASGDEPGASSERFKAGLSVKGEDKTIFVGVCPDLHLIDLRVFGDDRPGEGRDDAGTSATSTEYSVLAAIEFVGWLNRTNERPIVHGVNLSLAVPHSVAAYACGQTPICRACNALSRAGTVVVAAAGNSGFDIEAGKLSRGDGYRDISIADPGNAEDVITVGATHARDPHTYGISYFSGRGPTGDGRRKPDLVAPGERIRSTILWPCDPDDGFEEERLDCKDGTSMAAPHVSGAAALLMARHVELIGQPRRIKEILMRTATDLGRDPVFQGAGLVDVLRALQSV